MCSRCYKVYNPSYLSTFKLVTYPKYYCPDVTCGDELIELDEQMIPVIKTLAQKGYTTLNCCASHFYENNGFIPYISFMGLHAFDEELLNKYRLGVDYSVYDTKMVMTSKRFLSLDALLINNKIDGTDELYKKIYKGEAPLTFSLPSIYYRTDVSLVWDHKARPDNDIDCQIKVNKAMVSFLKFAQAVPDITISE